jgi:hypothetical protein
MSSMRNGISLAEIYVERDRYKGPVQAERDLYRNDLNKEDVPQPCRPCETVVQWHMNM